VSKATILSLIFSIISNSSCSSSIITVSNSIFGSFVFTKSPSFFTLSIIELMSKSINLSATFGIGLISGYLNSSRLISLLKRLVFSVTSSRLKNAFSLPSISLFFTAHWSSGLAPKI